MRAELGLSQFNDWQAAYNADPWGEERDDMRMARIVWAQLRPHSKRGLREDAFRFKFGPKVPPTPEEYRLKSMRAYVMQGGIITPKETDGQEHQQSLGRAVG